MPTAQTATTVLTSADDAPHASLAPHITPAAVGAARPPQPSTPEATPLDDLENPYDNIACTD